MNDEDDAWGRSNDDQAGKTEIGVEAPPNWPIAIIMISFFITLIVICAICTWGAVELGGVKI